MLLNEFNVEFYSPYVKLLIIWVGKTTDAYLKEGIALYTKRISHYLPVAEEVLKPSVLKDKEKALQEEGESVESKLKTGDVLVILDEKGQEMTSRQFAEKFNGWMNRGKSRIVFVAGGAYGISPSLKSRSDFIFSLSKLTFTHQMVRLVLTEQIYRAMTILRNEGYHHD